MKKPIPIIILSAMGAMNGVGAIALGVKRVFTYHL